jgi:glycosyltransferase involved in cell wall biosynthesis
VRICHVITRLILGGAQENTVLTCEGLRARGHQVALITGPALGPEGDLMGRALAGGYEVIVVDELRREVCPWWDFWAYRRLRELFKKLRPDVVHSHSSKAGILARRAAAKLGGMKIVHTIHGLPFHPHQCPCVHRLYIALERQAAARSDALISVAEAMTAQALAAGVGRAEQYHTIYSGIEVESFLHRPPEADEFRRALGVSEQDVLVTQVSRLAELKGHEYILAAAAQITDPHVQFCFVGDGRLRGKTEAQIGRAGLSGRVHLVGLLGPDRIPAVMHASDIVVHCSLHEGLARALPQAMLAGKPVVSFDVDGAREVVSAQTGILLPPKDVAGLKLAVETLADSPPLRHRLGQAGRELCQKRFDHRRMVEQIEALYRQLLR